MRRKGRRCKLTPELQDRIVELIRAGNYIETVCQAVGIGKTTFYRWLERGRNSKTKKGKFWEFWNAIKKAESEAEAFYLDQIRKAAVEGRWQAAAWYLERKYPDRWGRKDRHELSGPDGGPIELEVKGYVTISPDDWPDSGNTE